MSTDEPTEPPQPQETSADALTDELAKKYDPSRLLKIVSRRAGRGEALENSVRQKYEKRFGVDLGHVRVYTGEFAEEFNRQRNAYAVTVGSTGMILMGNSPEKSMGSAAGQALLAHELTHVAQQAKGLHRKATFDDAMPFAEEHEHEADMVEDAVHAEELGGAVAQMGSESTALAAMAGQARNQAQKTLSEATQKIKDRVIELLGDMVRNHMMRNGHVRRA